MDKIWNGKESDANIAGLNLPVDDNAVYKLVWNDEFDADSLDLRKWSGNNRGCWNEDYSFTYEYPYWRFGDGIATISMTRMDELDERGKRYKCGYSFVTRDTMNFQYGYLEMRAKIPFYGKGEFPSFWLLSSEAELARRQPDYESKSFRTEIDIFESFSSTGIVVPNLHKYENKQGGRHSQLSGIDHGASKSGTKSYKFPEGVEPNDWHTYGFLWTKDFMSFSVDGEFYYTYDLNKSFGGIEGMDGFHQPVGVIITNGIFSEAWCKINDWAASKGPASEEIFPLDFHVDYVRLYQKSEDSILLTDERPDRTSPIASYDGKGW